MTLARSVLLATPFRALFAGVAALVVAAVSHAQPCPPPTPGNLVGQTSLCSAGPRISFSVPSGQLLFPQLYRSATPDLSSATLVASGILNQTFVDDETGAANTDYYYWVRFQGINSSCSFGQFAGPVLAGRYALGNNTFQVPDLSLTPLCNGYRIDWRRIRENTGNIIVRRVEQPNTQIDLATLPAGSTTFTDTTGIPGRRYSYVVFMLGTCRGTEATDFQDAAPYPPVTSSPTVVSADVLAGAEAQLRVTHPNINPGISGVQWLRNGVPVAASPRIRGVDTTTMTFNPALVSDSGIYTFQGTTSCGPLPDIQVGLIVRPTCPADFDGNGTKNIDDIFIFISTWFQNCP